MRMFDDYDVKMDMKITRNAEGFRRVEVNGELLPLYTKGRISVTTLTSGPYWDKTAEPEVVGHIVYLPVAVWGGLVLDESEYDQITMNPPVHVGEAEGGRPPSENG
jgi:hypothetical protein